MGNPQVGVIGLEIRGTVRDQAGAVVNIASATVTKKLVLKKPNTSAVVQKDVAFVTDGSDGKFKYVTLANDLDEAGDWQLQGYFVITGAEFRTRVIRMTVEPNL